jgi:hypothetical protein
VYRKKIRNVFSVILCLLLDWMVARGNVVGFSRTMLQAVDSGFDSR